MMALNTMIRSIPMAMVVALISSSVAAQGCIKPAPPPVPAKGNLDASTRNAVTAQIEAYIAAANVYLACLEQSDARARAEVEGIIAQWSTPAVTDIQVVTD
jgi:hypothetical protein